LSARWVNYRELKATVSIVSILEHYGLLSTLKQKGDAYEGCCPIHKGDSPTQFRVSVRKNCWNCFSDSHDGGNIIDFVEQMEGVTTREAALLICDWFGISTEKPRQENDSDQVKTAQEPDHDHPAPSSPSLPGNAPGRDHDQASADVDDVNADVAFWHG